MAVRKEGGGASVPKAMFYESRSEDSKGIYVVKAVGGGLDRGLLENHATARPMLATSAILVGDPPRQSGSRIALGGGGVS